MALKGENKPIGNILSQESNGKKPIATIGIVLYEDQTVDLTGIENMDDKTLAFILNEAKHQIDSYRISVSVFDQLNNMEDKIPE